eukprot:scaffold3544_cov954-Pavlova_lutheri.AAC.1
METSFPSPHPAPKPPYPRSPTDPVGLELRWRNGITWVRSEGIHRDPIPRPHTMVSPLRGR